MNILLFVCLLGQQTVAPSIEPVGPARGTNIGDYNIRQSFETGYRFAAIDGNRGKYRSDVNFLNGLRLLGSSLTVHSRQGKGRLFDELIINTQGLGNDPYQFTNLRLEKNQLYRYDLTWRLNDYFNPALTIAFGQHWQNLQRRMQDHQFTLFPQGRFQFFYGLSRNIQDGPALSTANLLDARGNIFPFFEDVRRLQNEHRLGGLVQLAGFKFFFQRGWEDFAETTRGSLNGPGTPLDPTVTSTTLNGLRRDHPYTGITPHWRLNLFQEIARWYSVNARFTHSKGQRAFFFDELASGTIRGGARNLQTLVAGNARRPVTSANLTLSVFPLRALTLSNHTAFHSTRMEGDNTLQQITNGSLDFLTANFQFLGIRALTNSTLLDVAIRPWISLQGGYQFATRDIRSTEQLAEGAFRERFSFTQNNRLHAGTAGFRLRPIKGLTLVADGEVGRQNQPFYTTSDKDYHAFGARLEYKQKLYRLSSQVRTNVNFNSISLFRHSSRSRQYQIDGTLTPSTRFALDAGYQRLHLDTLTGIAYFLNFNQINSDSSWFVSNVHAAHSNLHLSLLRRLDLTLGVSLTRDSGGSPRPAFTQQPALLAAQSFPLNFFAPRFRFSYRISDKLRANFGFEHYRYSELILAFQNYRANTGFASVLWSF